MTMLEYSDIAEEIRAEIAGGYDTIVSRQGRQERARRKLRVDRGHYRELVAQRIAEIYESDLAIEQCCRHISLETNPLARIADAVSVVYKVPPVRTIGSAASLSGQVGRAMAAARGDATLRRASRVAFVTGSAWVRVFPMPRAGGVQPETEIITPATAVRAWYQSHRDHPDVLLATCRSEDDERIAYVVHDYTATRYLDTQGRVVLVREHGMGLPSLVEVRVDDRDDEDYWGEWINTRLYTSTIDVARLIAHIRWVRKAQSYKLMLMTGEFVDRLPAGQRKQPEEPIVTNADPESVRLEVIDMDTSVKNAEDEIAAQLHRIAESYGLRGRALDELEGGMQRGPDTGAMTPVEHAALSDLRDRQIMHLEDADRRMTALVCRAASMAQMRAPDHDRVIADLEINYAPLSYVDHPLQALRVAAEEIKLGQLDHVGLYMRMHPSVPREVAEKRVRSTIEVRNEINALLAAHQIPLDPREEGETTAARQGRVGGLARGNHMRDNQDGE